MKTQIKSPTAVAFGLSCVIGTVVVLFGHIRHFEELTLSHLYIMLSLIVTLGAGHFMWEAYKDGPFGFIRGIALTVLFIVGTIVCVGMSGGRSAAIIAQRDIDAQRAMQQRLELASRISAQTKKVAEQQTSSDLAAQRATLDERTAADQCKTGKGTKCDGTTLTAQASRANADKEYERLSGTIKDLNALQTQLDKTPIPSPPNAELDNFATVWAYLRNMQHEEALAEIKLFLPYALALLTEFGGIVFLKEGIGTPKPAPPVKPPVTIAQIAHELRLPSNVARRLCRDAKILKPAEGWVWSHDEAQDVKQRLLTARANGAAN